MNPAHLVRRCCSASVPSGRTARGGSVLLLLLLLLVVPSSGGELPKAEQGRVNDAIDKGVKFLRATQLPSGTWLGGDKHAVGYAALPGLTLLESGVPATDPAIKKVAYVIRHTYQRLEDTYEIALCILFLDRLGDPADKKIIQTLALRLIAGQSATGGWHYKCPLLAQSDERSLLTTLRQLPPPPPLVFDVSPAPVTVPATEPVTVSVTLPFVGSRSYPALPEPAATSPGTESPGATPDTAEPDADPALLQMDAFRATRQNYCIKALEPEPVPAEMPDVAKKDHPGGPAKPVVIPPRLRGLPIFIDVARLIMVDNPQHKTDNSNTQFATLALWVAQRYDVPMERTLRLLVRRFQVSQNPQLGGWDYDFVLGGSPKQTPQMSAVGLIGLAVGHGLAAPLPGAGVQRRVNDPAILNGFVAMSRAVFAPAGRMENLPQNVNLYFLWSLERVAVLYSLDRIADKDWYRWGAEILVANQAPAGNWDKGGYYGASPVLDTCLALLFLQRANFVKDLADKLPFNPNDLNNAVTAQAKPKTPPPAAPGEMEKPPLACPGVDPATATSATPATTTEPQDKVTPTKVEPDRSTESSHTATPPPEPEKHKILPYALLGLGILVVIALGVLAIQQLRGGAAEEEEEDEEDEKPRKKKSLKKSVKR